MEGSLDLHVQSCKKSISTRGTQKCLEKTKRKQQQNLRKVNSGRSVFKWALGTLCSAVYEHRWEDAFKLLPCVIIRMSSDVPYDFLWRVADVITRNATGISASRRQMLRRYVCSLKGQIHDVVLDTLSQDLQTASDVDIDNLIQMDDDFSQQQNCRWTFLGDRERLKGLSGGFIGRIYYQRWKNRQTDENHLVKLQDDKVSSSQSTDKDCPPMTGRFKREELTQGTNCKVLAKQAHSKIQKAISDLKEPCEWLMEQYLDLECELYGTEAAVNKLQAYLEKNTDHLPARRLSYHFYKNKVPNSNKNQIRELRKISKMCSDDPLVLEYVDLILKRAERDIFVPNDQQGDADSDSGLDAWENVETKPIAKKGNKPPCFLKSNENVRALKSCLHLLTTMLEYKELKWNLQPWQRLTNILRRFYVAWLRCWNCSLCKKSRTLVDAVGQRMTALWRYYVWISPPALIPLEKAQVLLHHAYAAYIFCYSVDYILGVKCALFSNGYNNLAVELEDSISYPGPFLKKFICYSDIKRTRLHLVMETSSSSYLYKKGSAEPHRVPSPVEDTNGTEKCDSTEFFESMCEDNDNERTKNDVDPLSLNNLENEESFNTGFGTGSLDLQCSQRLTNCKGGNDVSFNEQDIMITSTQIKAENSVSSLPSNLALNPAHNGSFIGLIRSRVTSVDDVSSSCMTSIGKCIKPSNEQKKRLKHSEIETNIDMEKVSSENIYQNTLPRVLVGKKDTCPKIREKSISNNRVIVERELSQQQHVLHDPVISQRLCFELQDCSRIDDVNKLELSKTSEPEDKTNCRESGSFSKDKEIKLNLHRRRTKAEAMIAHSLTSPNLEHQNRDLDMNFEEDRTYDPQFLYTCSFTGDCTSSNVDYDTAKHTSQEVNFPDIPIGTVLAESQTPDIRTANLSNTANCQGCEQNVLRDSEVNNVSQNVEICNTSIDKDQNDLDSDSKGNSFSRGVSEEDLDNSLTCGQRACSFNKYKAEISQKQGCSLPGNAEKVGEECVDFPFTPLPTSLCPDAILPFTGHCASSNVDYDTAKHISQEVNFSDIPIGTIAESQTPDICTANISNTTNCQGCKQNVLHDCEVNNASQNFEICNNSIDKDKNDLARDSKGNSLSCGVSEEDLDNSLTCGQRACGFSKYKAELSQKQGCSLPGNAEKVGEECVDFQFTPLPTSLCPDAILPCKQKSIFRTSAMVDETLSQIDVQLIDGVHFVPETQTQIMTVICDKDGGIGDDLESINSIGERQSEDNTKENIVFRTQQNIANSPYSLTPAQRIPSTDIKDVQDMCPSIHNMKNMDNANFCKTEEELGPDDQPDELLIMEDSKIGILVDTHPTASVSIPLKQKSVNHYNLPVTPPGQGTNLFSDDSTDKFNSIKSALERIVQSQYLHTPSVDGDQNEPSDSQEFIGPSQDEITSDAHKMYRLDLKNSHNSFSAGSTVSDSINGSDTEVTSDNVYGSLPAMQDISFSPQQQSAQTLRPERVQIDKENILEITPLSEMVCIEQEEQLELLSQDTNSGGTNCKTPPSNSSHAFASNRKVAKPQDLCHHQARTESSSNIISEKSKRVINENCNINISSDKDNPNSVMNKTNNICEPLEVKGCGVDALGFKNEEAIEETKEYKVEAWDFRIEEQERGDSMTEAWGSMTGETVEGNECLFTIASGGGEKRSSEPAFIQTINCVNKITVEPCSKHDKRVKKLKEKQRKKKVRTESESSEPVYIGTKYVNKIQNEKPFCRNDTGEKAREKQKKKKLKIGYKYSDIEYWNEFLDDLPVPNLDQINWKGEENIHIKHPKQIKKKKRIISYKGEKYNELRLSRQCANESHDEEEHKLSWFEDLPLPFDNLPETVEISRPVELDPLNDESSLIKLVSSEVEEVSLITKKMSKKKLKAKVTEMQEQAVSTNVMYTSSLSNDKVFKTKEKSRKKKKPVNDDKSSIEYSNANNYEVDSYNASSGRVKKRKQNSEKGVIAELNVIGLTESVIESQSKVKKKKSKHVQFISESEIAQPHSESSPKSNELSKRNSKNKFRDIIKKETEGMHDCVKSVEGLRSVDFCHDPKRKLKTRKKKWQVDIHNLTNPCNKRENGFKGINNYFDSSIYCEEQSQKSTCDLKEEMVEEDVSINMFSTKKKKKKCDSARENIELVQEKRISVPGRLSTSAGLVKESTREMNQVVFSSNDELKTSRCDSSLQSKQQQKQRKTFEKHLFDIDKSLKIQGNFIENVSNKSTSDMFHKTGKDLSKTKKQKFSEKIVENINLDVTYKNSDTPRRTCKISGNKIREIGYYIDYPVLRTVCSGSDEKINKLPVEVSFSEDKKLGQQQAESNNPGLLMTCEHSEETVSKEAVILKSINKRKSSARLSQRLLKKQIQPSPPWQNQPKFKRASHKLFNPNDWELL